MISKRVNTYDIDNIDLIPVPKKAKDLTGQSFKGGTVIGCAGKNSAGSVLWWVKCSCGNIYKTTGTSLKNEHTKSCGHLLYNDLTNKRFGKLIALEPINQRDKNRDIVWKCKCDCGTLCNISSTSLTAGRTRSCGCSNSRGEDKIIELLSKNNITYEKEKKFKTCIFPETNKLLRFDFYINNQYLIEFDGKQHFEYTNKDWNTEEKFKKTRERDQFKNQWCKENDIPLIRIPYWHLNNLCIEDLLLETSKFIYEID